MKKKIIAICSMVVFLVMCFAVNALAYDSVIGQKPYLNNEGKLTIQMWGQIKQFSNSGSFSVAEVTFTVPVDGRYVIRQVFAASPGDSSYRWRPSYHITTKLDDSDKDTVIVEEDYSGSYDWTTMDLTNGSVTRDSGGISLIAGKTYTFKNTSAKGSGVSVSMLGDGVVTVGIDCLLVSCDVYDGPPLEDIDPPVTGGTVVDPGDPDEEGSSAPGTSVLDKIAAAISGLESVSANFVAFLSSFLSWIPAEVKAVILGGVSMIVLLGVVKFVRG